MDFENSVMASDFEDESAGKLRRWKTADDSIWVSLDFPRVCMDTLIAASTKSCRTNKSCSLDSQNLDPVVSSEMFSCFLESARRKFEEAIAVSCKKPCCIEGRKEQLKKDRMETGCSFLDSMHVAPWDATIEGLGFKGFSQEIEVPESSSFGAFYAIKGASPTGGSPSEIGADSYFSEGTSLWQADTPMANTCGQDILGIEEMSDKPGKADDISHGMPPGSPPEGLFYVLSYLLLKDLLSLEQVCKSLKEAVVDDVLLWRHLKVDHSLSTKLTDERLLKLAGRGQGRLESLILVDCMRVSEEAVEQVVASNPMLSRICLPGCIRISVDAVVRMAEFLTKGQAQGRPGLKQVKIRGLSGVTKENLERLQAMLGVHDQQQLNSKPHFYLSGDVSTFVDERAIDVQACPKCRQPRAVFDCTRDKCRDWKALKIPECRGCIFCIARCEDCGMCIDDTDYEETFCLRLLCSDCWCRLPKCLECNRAGCESSSDHFIRRPDAMFVCPDCQGPNTTYISCCFWFLEDGSRLEIIWSFSLACSCVFGEEKHLILCRRTVPGCVVIVNVHILELGKLWTCCGQF